ncbi:hypothetical protein [Neobacillus piezotolerans]|uniref:hypothetical protein n=1 Tax=Neobacillus piezotolerans TaxID=2259171 RepID=UPI0015F15667|nr:hypothetical protein [Neobacillus piezotolerans]
MSNPIIWFQGWQAILPKIHPCPQKLAANQLNNYREVQAATPLSLFGMELHFKGNLTLIIRVLFQHTLKHLLQMKEVVLLCEPAAGSNNH